MASPTDNSARKDPVNSDTTRPASDATTRSPIKVEIPSTQQRDAEASTASVLNGKLVASPTHADPADQRKESVQSIDLSHSSRRSSGSSLRFEIPQRPGLPRGDSKGIDGRRIRNASPPPAKFRSHVAFDTISPDNTKNPGITLSTRHNGFQAQRRAKTFMVGVDEHKYSEEALEWLLMDMVDDHDTMVCVRVIEKDVKPHQSVTYKEQAHQLLQSIIKKNKLDKAICIILEYQFGRLGPTFDTLVNVHQPSMLVVGTKGKSNQGMQGMWNTRHSFSKYCLEKSSVPVVVVRPDSVRRKKMDKRSRDPSRNSYGQMLSATNGVHESDLLDDTLLLSTVTQLSFENEASQVAKALCLPAEFDPTIKGIDLASIHHTHSLPSIAIAEVPSGSPQAAAPAARSAGNSASNAIDSSIDVSDDDDGGDDDGDGSEEDEATLFNGASASANKPPEPVLGPTKMKKLHKMEVGEAAALKKRNTGDLEDY
ncbi:uncharacterized protein DNG_05630 [Cephalotrichum gorgonifer]|uniref:UspA domain-containing protein n=1 Tax=Cephalotrichum gorgonifer TaxID=2041049 RepID=A0AAE8MY81_9PEZI|nr:uncharacterized protein DNG_05630 [Cephalotrichum gorgonifer]